MPPLPLPACLALLTLLSIPLTMAQLECSEGQSRLDSGAFLECKQQHQARLRSMGIWIVRSTNPAWQVGASNLMVCSRRRQEEFQHVSTFKTSTTPASHSTPTAQLGKWPS